MLNIVCRFDPVLVHFFPQFLCFSATSLHTTALAIPASEQLWCIRVFGLGTEVQAQDVAWRIQLPGRASVLTARRRQKLVLIVAEYFRSELLRRFK